MKNGLNRTELIGNVGRDDAELGSLPGGTPVLNFSFAVNNTYKDKKSGEEKQVTDWFRIAVFGERAVKLAPYITSGKTLFLGGRVAAGGWLGDDGKVRTDVILKINQGEGVVKFLDRKTGDKENYFDEEIVAPEDEFDEIYPAG